MKPLRLARLHPNLQQPEAGHHRQLPQGARAASPQLPPRVQPPEGLPSVPGLEIAAATYPDVETEPIRGDFVDVFGLDGSFGFAWGALSGCGAEVGPMVAASKALLRATLISHPAVGATAHRLSRSMYPMLSEGRSLALTFGLYDPEDRRFVLCSCGSWPALAISEGQARLVGSPGPLLGDYDAWRYPPTAITLAPGTVLFGSTVGIVAADGAPASTTSITALVECHPSLPALAAAILRPDTDGRRRPEPRPGTVLVLRAVGTG